MARTNGPSKNLVREKIPLPGDPRVEFLNRSADSLIRVNAVLHFREAELLSAVLNGPGLDYAAAA
jgi:hypothetical protein